MDDAADDGDRWITTIAAATRLGVKAETLYAYVSRGIVRSRLAPDGRSSLFDATEIERLRARRRGAGRAGAVEATVLSAITRVADHRLWYRGHDVLALARDGVAFERVAALLWRGELPDTARVVAPEPVIAGVGVAVATLAPDAPLIDRLRVAIAVASSHDAFRADRRPAAVESAGAAIVAAMVAAVAAPATIARGPVAARLAAGLGASPSARRWAPAVDAALVLLADHDIAASTFAARVAASTRADPYSVVSAGLGAFGGPLHGAASGPVHDLLVAARTTSAAHVVGRLVRDDAAPATTAPLAGFGHFLYPKGDPRAAVLLDRVAEAAARSPQWRVVDEVRALVRDQRGVEPNVDFAMAALTACAGLPRDAGEVIFAIARSAGWLAHALEEYGESPLRFRPVARYVGP